MSLAAVFLLIISAGVHAGWNLLGKRQNPSTAVFLAANTLGLVILAPSVIFAPRALPFFSLQVWLLLLITGLFQALYYVALAGAYRSGDLSLAYPMARAAPVVIVVLINFVIGRGSQLSPLYLAGALLVSIGIILTPLERFGTLRLKDYLNLTCLLALSAAACTAAYSMIDDQSLRILRTTPGLPVSSTEVTVLFAFLEGLVSSFWLGVIVLASRTGRAEFRAIVRADLRQPLLIGTGMYLAYTLVLIAMGFASNVSYIVTFRQLSIPLGAVLGVTLLKETPYPPRVAGVSVIFAGLVLVGLG